MENQMKQEIDTLSPEYCKWKFINWLCKIFIIIFKKRKGGDPCVYIPGPIINRPDPCIYSQFLLMQLHQPVTWDNPDVSLFLNGVEQYTYDLVTNTEYDVVVTVHNSSREKVAAGTRVDIRWIEFGAGSQIRHPISILSTNVPVWPNTSQVNTKWKTPASPGHYCLEIELFHSDDGNPSNNRGWNNTQVKAAQSQLNTPVRIFNQYLMGCPPDKPLPANKNGWGRLLLLWGSIGIAVGYGLKYFKSEWFSQNNLLFNLVFGYLAGVLAGYAILGPPIRKHYEGNNRKKIPCNLVEITIDSYVFEDKVGKDADPNVMFEPAPPAWPAHIEPATFHFLQNETYRDVNLIVDAPNDIRASANFNINVWQGGYPTGGVTVKVLTKNM
jgi:hypothetical protein